MTLSARMAAPPAPLVERSRRPETAGAILARSGLGWRGQRPTTELSMSAGPTAPARLASDTDRGGTSGAVHARRHRTLTEAELFLGHGLDDSGVREVLG